MRHDNPVYFSQDYGAWHVFRYADVQQVLQDHATFSSNMSSRMGPEASALLQSSIISLDPPRHRLLRSLVTKALTPKKVIEMATRIQMLTDQLLEAGRDTGRMDVIDDLAYPLPVIVIAELLGVPAQDRERFKYWSDVIVGSEIHQDQMTDLRNEMAEYFLRVVEERRREPGNDLITALLAAEVDGERLSLRELLGFCVLLLVAGNETTTNLIGNAVYCFTQQPDTIPRLIETPSLLPNAIEEVLRYRSPVQVLPHRFARVDTTIDGHEILPGQQLLVWLGSANRDESVFRVADRFIIDRVPNPHIAFGAGIHFCLGANLARLEARIALSTLLSRCREIVVDEAGVEWIRGGIVHGLKRLPVQFQPG
jgi:cytochrome P450